MERRPITRREFLKESALVGAAAAAAPALGRGAFGAEAAAEAPAKMPMIKLGKLEVSRLILGSNPFFGFSHGNPQASGGEMRQWYTDEQVMAVMDKAAEHGINAVWTPCYDHWIRLWNKYREKGGKLKIWIGQPDRYKEMKQHITACAKNGGKAICIQGVCVDAAMRGKLFDLVKEWLELIRSFGLPAGMASHQPGTHLIAEDQKLPTDFYHQCLGTPERYTGEWREKALATMRKIDKPMVGYKVLGAGRLDPKEALPHVLKSIKPIDGVCIGVFPKKKDEIAENAALVAELTKAATSRPAEKEAGAKA